MVFEADYKEIKL